MSFLAHEENVTCVYFSPDGLSIVSSSDDSTIRLWNLEGNQITQFRHSDWVHNIVVSPDGNCIVSASRDATVRVWNIDGTLLHTLEGHRGSVLAVAMSPDGTTIVSGSSNGAVRVWSIDGILLHTLEGHTSSVQSVAFSPDGNTIASGSDDQTVRFWELNSGQQINTLLGHTDTIYSVAFSPDDQLFVSGSRDKTIRVWSRNGSLVGEPLQAHERGVNSVAFSPDSRILASCSGDRSIKLWRKQESKRANSEQRLLDVTDVASNNSVKKILILTANPKNTAKLDLAGEVAQIQKSLENSGQQKQFEIVVVRAVTADRLQQVMLEHDPQIVHFSGHGTGEELILEDHAGRTQLVDTQALTQLFDLFQESVECVLLNVNYSEVHATEISQHINYVIGARVVTDTTAKRFALSFYNALFSGRSIEDSYRFGCNAIALDGSTEDSAYVLKKKSDFPLKILSDELRSAMAIPDEQERTKTLEHLISRSPETPSKLIRSLSTIKDEAERILALITLIPHLPPAVLSTVPARDIALFQHQQGIPADGICGPQTLQAIAEVLRATRTQATETPSRISLWHIGNTQVYALCTSTPWNLPFDALVLPVGHQGGLGTLASAFQEFLGMNSKWLSQAINKAMKAKKLRYIKLEQPLLVKLPPEANTQISSLIGTAAKQSIICATSESEHELSSSNTTIAYEAVVRLAVEQRFRRVIIPLIGTGVNQLPVDEVARGMLRAINDVLESLQSLNLEEITIVDRDEDKIAAVTRISRPIRSIVENNYRQAFKSAIARIYTKNGTVVGAGFLVADRQLLTCAHVVTAALRLPTTTQEAPADWVELDFPLTAPGQKFRAKVAFWRPVQLQALTAPEEGEDIAGLVLEDPPPSGCQPVRLVSSNELRAHAFQIFGFPAQRDDGIWASGVIRDRLASGWVQIEDIKAQGHPVQLGFSGAPIWDEQVEGVVGMAVAADKKRDETKTAFMIPTSILTRAWGELGKSVQLPEAPKPNLENQIMKDFFISYNRADKQWAEWIAWTLEEAGYSVLIQAWDFRPGGNFVLDMQRAAAESQKTITVLSESYLKASFTQPEWAAAFAQDPQSLERKLIPLRVKECNPEGLLKSIVYVDLVGLSEPDAKQALLSGVAEGRAKPEDKPGFPASSVSTSPTTQGQVVAEPKPFPSAVSRVQQVKAKGLQIQLDNLIAEHEALNQQLSNTTDAVEHLRRERQLEDIAKQMNTVAEKLDALGA